MKIYRHRWYHDREMLQAVVLMLSAVGCAASVFLAAMLHCRTGRESRVESREQEERTPTLAMPLETSTARERSLMVPGGGSSVESRETRVESQKDE